MNFMFSLWCGLRISAHKISRILKENRHCGLKLVKDKRHITIGWHQCGRVKEAVKRILDASLGQFRQQVQGVPLAIGKIRVPANGTVIGSQMCMHMEVVADMIVFRPKPGKVYKCVVTSIDKEYLTAKVFGAISFVASLKRAKSKPDIGDEVNIKFSALTFRGNICQMKGVLCNGEDTVTICHLLNFILLIY
uniref:GTP_EFTU_D3 domain-containing protein n=1 Tax=Syphacia muris TaxID=451379 RepID=A0A0N5ADY7_9BILA